VGRQTKIHNTDLAYIAGFLDGDGSVMVQIKKRKDTSRGWRLMFTICFYQDSRHERPLFWIRKKLGIGYISRRNDGITELRINGYEETRRILEQLYPYIRFKKKQIGYVLQILRILKSRENLFELKRKDRRKIAHALLKSREETYQSGMKKIEKLKSDLAKILEM
jgi:hypothetical protein